MWAFDWYQNRWPWMTLNGVMAVILSYFTEFGSFGGGLRQTSNWFKIDLCCLWQKNPKYLFFSDILFLTIFAEVTQNECFVARHLHDLAIVVYMPNMAESPSNSTNFVFYHFSPNITAELKCSWKAVQSSLMNQPYLYRVRRFQSNNHICTESHNRRIGCFACLKVGLRSIWSKWTYQHHVALVCLSLCLSVTLVIDA